MPKQKQFLKAQRKSVKPKDTTPRTANEFLAVGVDHEEAGEKWRAGDAQKSARFFLRALEDYDAGLKTFPTSFDLAYNRARLQYEVAQQPRLLPYVPGDLLHLLKTALASHRYALEISQANADLLFNTGQVLTSLAEFIGESRHRLHDAANADPLHLFQEALEYFQRCLRLQDHQLSQLEAESSTSGRQSMEVDEPLVQTASGNASALNHSAMEPSGEDTWAMIVEPVTSHALMDTLLAQMETLTSVCGFLSARRPWDLDWIEQYFQNPPQKEIFLCAEKTGREHEIALTRAKFKCALADAKFSNAKIDIPTYEFELAGAYGEVGDVCQDPQALCDRADAEIAFNANMQRASIQFIETVSEDSSKMNVIRWKHITKALDNLTIASKLQDAKNLSRIHLRRGDCELLRRRLGASPSSYDIALKSASTLLKNAEIYYKGAARLARAEAATDEEREASTKEAVAAALLGDPSKLCERIELDRSRAQDILEDMSEEGLLLEEDMKILRF